MSSLKEACSPPTDVSVGMSGAGREVSAVRVLGLCPCGGFAVASRAGQRGVRMGGICSVLSWPH